MTFLWRDGAPGAGAAVITQLAPRLRGTGAAPLARLPASDVWYGTFRTRADTRTTYWLSVTAAAPAGPDDGWVVDDAHWRADPRNPRTTPEVPPASLLSLPAAPTPRWSVARPGVPPGRLAEQRLRSTILGNERRVWVYTPPAGDRAEGPADLLVLFDGWAYAHLVPTAAILDNLTAAGRLPPTVAVLVGNPDAAARQRELGCHESHAAFVAEELLPWVRARWAVAADPARCVVGGSSRGALAAAFVALRRPDRFGHALCQSGAFAYRPEGDPEPEWLARQVAAAPRAPVRFHLDVGLLETGAEGGDVPTLLTANRHLRDVLRAKGYAVHYGEFAGGHSYACWELTLPEGLLALRGADGTQAPGGVPGGAR